MPSPSVPSKSCWPPAPGIRLFGSGTCSSTREWWRNWFTCLMVREGGREEGGRVGVRKGGGEGGPPASGSGEIGSCV